MCTTVPRTRFDPSIPSEDISSSLLRSQLPCIWSFGRSLPPTCGPHFPARGLQFEHPGCLGCVVDVSISFSGWCRRLAQRHQETKRGGLNISCFHSIKNAQRRGGGACFFIIPLPRPSLLLLRIRR